MASAARGFSLIETLVAVALLATAAVSLAQLAGLAVRSNLASRDRTYATVLAQQKLESLAAIDADALTASPAAALDADTPGWVDYISGAGHVLGGQGRPRNTAYVRRWSVEPLAELPGRVWVVQVVVARPPESVRLATLRTRRTP